MPETVCEQIQQRIALGESQDSAEIASHLQSCEACRHEAARLGAVLTLLAEDAEAVVQPELDRQVRSMIGEAPVAGRSYLRPRLAIALAAIALLAGIIAVVGFVTRGASAQEDCFRAFAIVWTYLAISSVATLPILIHKKVLVRHQICEV